MIKRLSAIVAATIIGSLISPGIASARPAEDNGCWGYAGAERAFAKNNNSERSSEGRAKLSLDPELSRVALEHTKEMVEASSGEINGDDLFHSTPRQLRKRVTGDWKSLGENVGVGGSASSLHKAFMNSAVHRENMLKSAHNQVGVGVITKGDHVWVTVLFSSGGEPGTSLPMPSC